MAQYDRRPGDTALCFASWARTALDDPMAVADEDLDRSWEQLPEAIRPSVFRDVTPAHLKYAIDRIDDLFEMLDPAEETRETLARALAEAGLIVRSIQETVASIAEDGGEDGEAYGEADGHISTALDALDEAIETLVPGYPG